MFRRTLMAVMACAIALVSFQWAIADVYVRGYYRKDGTYVAPHYRSNPDGNPYNNWGTYPNVNPHTGDIGTRHLPSPNYQGITDPAYQSPLYGDDYDASGEW